MLNFIIKTKNRIVITFYFDLVNVFLHFIEINKFIVELLLLICLLVNKNKV